MNYDPRPKREQWPVEILVSSLGAAVVKRIGWHTARHDHWVKERSQLMAQAQEAIRVDDPEELEKFASSITSNNYQPQLGVRLDPEWAEKFRFADRKMKEHAVKTKEFVEWSRTLGLMDPQARLTLEHNDRQYFGLVPTAEQVAPTDDEK